MKRETYYDGMNDVSMESRVHVEKILQSAFTDRWLCM